MKASLVLSCVALVMSAAATAKAQEPNALTPPDSDSSPSCSKSLLFNFDVIRDGELRAEIPIWQMPESSAFFYETGMAIDADGAPNAYNPDNTGLDDLENAGEPGHWWALAVDETGEPFIQGAGDPFPGHYVSTTALADREKDRRDPTRFVDASSIPYIVLPAPVIRQTGVHLGDFAMVFNLDNGKASSAIFADEGPSVGEGSVALADSLGIRSDARRGGARGDIVYLVFPGSGNGRPRPLAEINEETAKLVGDSEADPVTACSEAY
jgi:hypothetical protein